MSRCAVRGCEHKSNNWYGSFFRFPKEPERSKIWLALCERDDLQLKTTEQLASHYRICSTHFETRMLAGLSTNKLKRTAFPTIFRGEEGSYPRIRQEGHVDVSNEEPENPVLQSDADTHITVSSDSQQTEDSVLVTEAHKTSTEPVEYEVPNSDGNSSGFQLSSTTSLWVMDIYAKKCRICLNQKLVKMCKNVLDKYHYSIPSISEMLTFCIPQLVGHILPSDNVCLQCLDELVSCVKFIEKCLASDALLQAERAPKSLPGSGNIKLEINGSSSYGPSIYDHNYVSVNEIHEGNSNMKFEVDEKIELLDAPQFIEKSQLPDDDSENGGDDVNGNDDDDDYNMSLSESEDDRDVSPEDSHLGTCGIFKHVPERYRTNRSEANQSPSRKQFTCKKCGRLFPRRNRLLKHQEKFKEFSECAFYCDNCGKRYTVERSFLDHQCDGNQENMDCDRCVKNLAHICTECKLGFIGHQGYVEHECFGKYQPECVPCSQQKGHTCVKCKKTYFLHSFYVEHACLQEEVTFCIHCSKKVLKADYERHLKEHSIIECENCQRAFTSVDAVKIHSLTHLDPKFKQCPECENVYKDEELLNKHLSEIHNIFEKSHDQEDVLTTSDVVIEVESDNDDDDDEVSKEKNVDNNAMLFNALLGGKKENEEPEVRTAKMTIVERKKKVGKNDSATKPRHTRFRTKKTYYCYICQRVFHVFNKLLHHLVQTNIHRQEFPCRSCEEKSPSYVDLKNHLRNEHNYEVFCDKCFTAFESEEQLQKHNMVYQKKGKPCGFCVCEKCNRRFWEEEEYVEHLQFPNCECKRCPTCSKLIATAEYVNHMSEHQPYPCTKCGNRFTSKKSLETHMSTQHNEDAHWVPCPDCSNMYKDNLALKCHQRRVHRTFIRQSTKSKTLSTRPVKPKTLRKLHSCPICYRKFRDYRRMLYHVVGKDTHLSEFPCNRCDTQFTSYGDIKKHLRERHFLQHFCDNCYDSFDSEEQLKTHQDLNTHKVKPCGFWACEKCNKRFATKITYEEHSKLTSCELHVCSVCKLVFPEEEFKKHTHQKYMCELCGKSFTSNNSLNLHLATKKHTNKEDMIVCEVCGNSFTAQYLKLHMRHTHLGKQKTLMCSYCPLKFFYPKQLKNHEKTHTKTKDIPCNECGKCFRTTYSKSLHYRTVHLKLKPVKCKECGHEFSRKGNLLQHLKVHQKTEDNKNKRIIRKRRRFKTDRKFVTTEDGAYGGLSAFGSPPYDPGLPVKCYFCGRILKSLAFLRGHVRNTHAKIRRFKCNLCEMTFIIKVTLDKHLKLHEDPLFKFRCKVCFKRSRNQEEFDEHSKKHTKLDFKCESCSKSFAREYLLESHKESVHPNHEENTQKYERMLDIAFKNAVFVEEVPRKKVKVDAVMPN